MFVEQAAEGRNDAQTWFVNHWFAVFAWVYGLWVFLPFLAPVFIRIGWEAPGRFIYFFYSFFCHQLPERSFFLFGPEFMYSLPVIQAQWIDTINPLILRKFVGLPELGWKVAWSDRMVYLYGSIWLFSLAWYVMRDRIKALSIMGFVVLCLPIVIDVAAHIISDTAGIGLGFRDSNLWLVGLSQGIFGSDFYAGDAFGSFNSWVRMISGILAGLGFVWLLFPRVNKIVMLAAIDYRVR